ncbi:hypothetical protein SteCoe_33750 [Stentor coeruleus]|uniref:Uncharacterized protein n=1 Tax=Stentor coeruleus TaxID=5963 RepID=A0A1R2AW18_9CILI|nr:hypothetical protein SteCoe_33750 [Stentor coeruleus]
MSTGQDKPPYQSSRDIILSRYQNVKNLLSSKGKAVTNPSDTKSLDKPQVFNTQPAKPKNIEEENSRRAHILSLCNRLQEKIDEIAPRKLINRYSTLQKPSVPIIFIQEKTVIKVFSIVQLPKCPEYYCEKSIKAFKIVQKVYQILEFHEKKEESSRKAPIKKVQDMHVQASQNESMNLFSSSFVETRNRSKSPVFAYEPNEKSIRMNESFITPTKNSSFITPNPILSYDQFMNNDRSLRNNTSNIAQSQKITKQAQLLQFKQKAKEKELLMQRRKRSVIKIQALYRGWKQRKKFIKIWERLQRKKKLDRLKDISIRIKELFAPYVILKALRKWLAYRKQEKRRIMIMFRDYSAVYIQKNWRGYMVRRFYHFIIKQRSRAKCYIRALLKGWKIRKIMKSRDIKNLKAGLSDLQALEKELAAPGQNISLKNQVSGQIPIMKEKIIRDIHKLYRTGKYLKTQGPSLQSSAFESFATAEPSMIKGISPIRSREEEPVKQAENPEEPEVIEIEVPKKTFTNFLRRGQNTKYNPKAISTKPKPPPQEILEPKVEPKPEPKPEIIELRFDTKESQDTKSTREVKKDNKKIKQLQHKNSIDIDIEESDSAFVDGDMDPSKPCHNFLKRKSQTYKPTKVEWKAKPRIDCWGESVVLEPKARKSPKKTSVMGSLSFSRVQELEFIFDDLFRTHIPLEIHFGISTRTMTDSIIPQFVPDSLFIMEFSDEMHQEMFEALQTHYLYLCNEDDIH